MEIGLGGATGLTVRLGEDGRTTGLKGTPLPGWVEVWGLLDMRGRTEVGGEWFVSDPSLVQRQDLPTVSVRVFVPTGPLQFLSVWRSG